MTLRSAYWKSLLFICSLTLIGLLGLGIQTTAQTQAQGNFSYGETVLGKLDENDATPHIWVFSAREHELFSIRLQRIGGQFSPEMTLISPNGAVISHTHSLTQEADSTWLLFQQGVEEAGEYQVHITGDTSNSIDNPNEYSLTLLYEGVKRTHTDENLSPLPQRNAADMPNLQEGSPKVQAKIDMRYYGGRSLQQPNSRQQRNRWLLRGDGFTIDMDNANPLNRGIESLSILEEGVGLTMIDGQQFFSDSSIAQLTYAQSILKITLADGRSIETDFYRIRQLQAVDGLFIVTTTDDQRIIFKGTHFDFKRRGGLNGEGPNVEPINVFKVDGFTLSSDLSLWHTLYYDTQNPELRVLYGADTRFISAYLNATLVQRGNQEKPELNTAEVNTDYLDITLWENAANNPRSFTFAFETFGMGDIAVGETTLTITPLDGRSITEEVSTFHNLLVEDRGLRVIRTDGTYRVSLPDGTDIQTPASTVDNRNISPNAAAYRPNHANNLGTHLYDYHPQVSWDEFLLPVNPVNGNFFYSVNDIAIPSHALALNWTRYYNSLSPDSLTPAYYSTANTPYLFGNMGQQWRHSYQYELDIRYAPLGEIWLNLPDGSRHVFRSADALNNPVAVFRSTTMMSWEIHRQNGLMAEWVAFNGDGESYHFDRAGRLNKINDLQDNRLLFSPAPRELVSQHEQERGFFITERYGRRIEVYTDTDGIIKFVRQQLEFTYHHDASGNLIKVDYPSVLQNPAGDAPNYDYDEQGLLAQINDKRSPYHPEMRINYGLDGRVENWTINADERSNSPALTTHVSYENGLTRLSIIRGQGQQQSQIVTYDTENRISEHTLTDGSTSRSRSFAYDTQSGRLYQHRQINGARYTYVYNDRGYLTRLSTPSTRDYGFTYQAGVNGISQVLTAIQYPNNTQITYQYTPEFSQITSVQQPLDDNRVLVTTYTYDDWGRLQQQTEPNPNNENSLRITEYSYDEFGYPNQIQVYDSDQPDVKYTLQMSSDISGRLTEIVDWRGQPIAIQWDNQRNLMTAYTYGELNRLVNHIEFQYDEYSNLIERRSQGLAETFTYNGLNLLASATDGMGRLSSYRYDIFGNLIEEARPAGSTENASTVQIFRYEYNGVNELTAYILPNDERYQIDYQIERSGVPTSFTVQSPDGQVIRYTYNVDNQITQVTQTSASGTVSYNYLFSYDPRGNLITLEETHGSGRTLQVSYNAARLPVATRVSGIETRYTYNHAGHLSQITNADGASSHYLHDLNGNIIQVTLPDNDNNEATPPPTYAYAYDETGNLIQFIDALGNTTAYTYDEINRVIAIIDADDNLTEYEYDHRDNVVSITYPNGNVIQAEYNDANLMTRWIDAMGRAITYDYDQSNRLTQIRDLNDVVSTFTYDSPGNLVAKSITTSRETLYSYDNANRLISETNALGQTITYNYNNLNRISQIVDSLGNIERYTWTGAGFLNIFTNKANQRFDYATDSLGRMQQMNTPDQLERFVLTYSNSGLVNSLRHTSEGLNNNYTYTYYPNGMLASMQSPVMDGRWDFAYDTMRQLTTITSPTGDTTSYQYDAFGRIIQASYPDRSNEQWEYDSVGNITQYTARNGIVSRYQYDANNRVNIREDEADGLTRQYRYTYSYNAPQLVISDPNNHETRYYYDRFGNVTKIEHVAGSEEETQIAAYAYEYDRLDNIVSIIAPAIDAQGNQPTQRFSYNALNQLTRYIDTTGGSWAYGYDTTGNLNHINDPLGNVINYVYDGNNRIMSIQYNNGAFAEFRYNVRANTLSAPENRTRDQANRIPILYSFDFDKRLIGIEHSANSRILFERDDLGRVERMQTANGASINFSYNANGQITQITSPEGTINRQYDASGNLISASGTGQSAEFGYDAFGYLTRFEQDNHLITYERDIIGNLLSANSSLRGETTYTHDALYRIINIEAASQNLEITRNEIGWPTLLTYDTGFLTLYTYTPSSRVENLVYRSGQNNYTFNYQYDDVGNLTRSTRSDNTPHLITRDTLYTYGRNNELIGERWLDDNNEVVYAITYAYDLAGNRTQSIRYTTNSNAFRTIYLYNNTNQLVEELRGVPADLFDRYTANVINNADLSKEAKEKLQYQYDSAGNLTSFTHPNGSLNYRYDSWNRLLAVTGQNEQAATVDVSIQYNILGQIYRMEINGKRYSFAYDQALLTAIRNDTDGTLETYHYSPEGNLLWRETAAGIQYPLVDGLKNIRLWVDVDGQSVDGARGVNIDAFGNLISPYDSDSGLPVENTPQLLYGGQIYEPSSGLHILGVRAYMPHIGRFIQRDPVRHDPQSSLYTYVQNRPTYAVDNSGMIAETGFIQAQAINYPDKDTSNSTRTLTETSSSPVQRVIQAQALEDQRLLDVAESLRRDFNPSQFHVDETLCLRAIGGQRQAPQDITLHPALRPVNGGNGWIADNEPNPDAPINRNAILATINQVMTAVNNNGLINTDNCNQRLQQPETGFVNPSQFMFQHTNLRNHLNTNALYAALSLEIPVLLDGAHNYPTAPTPFEEPQMRAIPLPLLIPGTINNMLSDTYHLTQSAILPLYEGSTLIHSHDGTSFSGFSFNNHIFND